MAIPTTTAALAYAAPTSPPPSPPPTIPTAAASTPSARDYAVTVLLANDATTDQTRHADHYLTDAEAFIAITADH